MKKKPQKTKPNRLAEAAKRLEATIPKKPKKTKTAKASSEEE